MNSKSNRPLGRPKSSEQKAPTNQLILQAATELFLAEGYQKVSIDEVAGKAGLTKATIYYYYKSKADLFTETMVQMMIRIRSHMETMLSTDSSLYTRLLQVAHAHLQATVDIDLDGFMRETKNALSPAQIKKVQSAEENMYQTLENTFITAMENKEINKINSTFAAHAFMSLLKVGNYRNPDGTSIFPSTEETAEHIVGFFWKGLTDK